MTRLTDNELEDAKRSLQKARASLACEGLYLTAEQEARFQQAENERLSHEERRQRIIEAYAPSDKLRVDAAE
jgi:hypothetical protein